MSCQVKLIAHTTEPAKVVAAAARLCYSATPAGALFDGLDGARTRDFLAKLLSVGHMSPFEHASFTFAIDGLSRVASHQLVRHRIASFSQQSQRYVTMGEPRLVKPPSIAGDADAARAFDEALREAYGAYERLVEMGIPKEDARFVLPHGWETSLVMTMNARELHHFFALRLCRRAQWEIRGLARQMLASALDVAPELFGHVGPGCATFGACREYQPCGRPYADMQAILNEEEEEKI